MSGFKPIDHGQAREFKNLWVLNNIPKDAACMESLTNLLKRVPVIYPFYQNLVIIFWYFSNNGYGSCFYITCKCKSLRYSQNVKLRFIYLN